MMKATVIALLLLASVLGAIAASVSETDEDAIRRVIEQRRLAWNAQDTKAYASLLTPDADIVSATGRSAHGRDEVIQLYVEQRSGAYRGATVVSTFVTRIKFVRPEVAVVDADFEIEGVRGRDGNTMPPVNGLNSFVLVKGNGRWLILSIHGIPKSPIHVPKQ